MTQDLFDAEILPPQRPVFLKVLCMLTFIGSGYGIINATVTYFKADTISEMVAKTRVKVNDDISKKKRGNDTGSVNFTRKIFANMSVMMTPDNLRRSSVTNIITSVICLLGAFLMWKLRRIGYYIYILGTLVSIILPFYLFGSNFITNLSTGVLGFIGILFIVFYGLNIKSMK